MRSLTLVARLRGASPNTAREALGEVGLVALAAARIGSPRVVLLDDPLEAMDRAITDALLGWIAAWVDTGAAVVGSSSSSRCPSIRETGSPRSKRSLESDALGSPVTAPFCSV